MAVMFIGMAEVSSNDITVRALLATVR